MKYDRHNPTHFHPRQCSNSCNTAYDRSTRCIYLKTSRIRKNFRFSRPWLPRSLIWDVKSYSLVGALLPRLLRMQVLLKYRYLFTTKQWNIWNVTWEAIGLVINHGTAHREVSPELMKMRAETVQWIDYGHFFIIKPTRCINFPNLLRHETLHVSGSSSAHHQEFIHCTLRNGTCHTGL
jgi:hypothetical protein